MNKSRKKIAQDYSRNAMADAKSSSAKVRKEGRYEAKQAVRAASGAPIRMESAKQEKKNLMQDMPIDKKASALNNLNKGYGYEVKSPMNMGGSWMSKHSSSHMAKGSPMHKQGYNARLDETLGSKDGKESKMMQSMKDRRDESKGMKKSKGKGAYSSDTKMS
tara:strand:- start:2990 stop:3475 length:486 start_codon:yes stop_codon:yes gene_type:complete